MATIVTLTPVAIENDSRTFKQAASVARFGHTSIVIEGTASALDRITLPFELTAISGRAQRSPDAVARRASPGAPGGVVARAKDRVRNSWWGIPLRLMNYLRVHGYRYGLLTLRRTPRAELYYLHCFYQFPAVYLLCRLYGAQYVYDAHDFYSQIDETRSRRGLEKNLILPFERWLEGQCATHAATVVTVSVGLANLLQHTFGCHPLVVRNTQDSRLDRRPPQTLRELLGLSDGEFLLVTVGLAKRGQAVPQVLEAMSHLPDSVHLAFVGNGYEQYRDVLEARQLLRRVHLVPSVKPFEVAPFIRTADAALILYYPRSVNYLYCLPNGFFQAISAELPLLYPDLPEIRRIAGEYQLGLRIDPQSVESIRAAVTQLIAAPGEMAVYRQNLRRAHHELHWEGEEQILKKLIQSLLQSPGNAACVASLE